MKNHVEYIKLIKPYLNNTLSQSDRRRFIFHLNECSNCKDTLLEEYMFNVIFYDKDSNIKSSYTDNLNKLLIDEKNQIIELDKKLNYQYIFFSIVIIFCLAIIFSFFMLLVIR